MSRDRERDRIVALERIRRNIESHGYHVYLVAGGPSPRWAYTIGLTETRGAELVLAGAAHFTSDETGRIIDRLCDLGLRDGDPRPAEPAWSGELGAFSLRPIHASWIESMLDGALDYYSGRTIEAMQIVPDSRHSTIDVPDMSKPWSSDAEGPWRWLCDDPWAYPVPSDSLAMTNLAALRGERITQAARWETDQWELFAGDGADVSHADARAVPLSTLLGHDRSLEPVVHLMPGGAGLVRGPEPHSRWRPWGGLPATSR